MPGLKQKVFAATATAVLLCLPITPAAASPLFFAPWALGHVIVAAARLATLPLVVASEVASAQQPQAPYPSTPGYYGGPAPYYAQSNYNARPPAYYPQPPAYYPQPPAYYPQPPAYYGQAPAYYGQPSGYYAQPSRYYAAPQAYYRPALAYARPMPQFYAQPRGFYAPRTPYSGSYGAGGFRRSGGFSYRRR
jgi:hypothetical protein